MKLYIKNMVCTRCIMVVKEELARLEINHLSVELGEVEIIGPFTRELQSQLKICLSKYGLEVIDDRKSVLIERVKNAVVEMVHLLEEPLMVNFSTYLSEKTGYDYTYLANVFAETHGTTISKFIISHKIERVKELLLYDELNLTEIAYLMHYSSVAHLSNQFKKTTGLSPSRYKQLKYKVRYMLENV